MLADFLRLKDDNKDEEWYKFQANRIIPAHQNMVIEDYYEMDKLYKFLGNDFTAFTEEIKYYCGSLEEFGATEEELVPYNPVPNKFEVLKGDLLSRGFNYRIMLMTAKAVRQKNEEFVKRIQMSVEQELAAAIQEQKLQLEQMDQEQIDKYIEQMRTQAMPWDIDKKNFLSEGEIVFSKLLQYTYKDQDIKSKMLETLEDILAVSRMYVYTGWKMGRPHIEVLNPKHLGFNKNPNEAYIQRGDYVWYRDEITVADALDEYINKLSKEDLAKLITYGHSVNPLSKDHMTKPVFDHSRYYSLLTALGETNNKGEGTHQGTSLTNVNLRNTLWRTHMEFKAYRSVVFLTQEDEYGDKVTVTLDDASNIIPETASKVKFVNRYGDETEKYMWSDSFGDYEAEVLWIPRRYELTRLGSDIYVDMREVPYQPDYGVHVFSRFELSYKGCVLFNRNTKWVSPLMRAIPYAFQHMTVKRLQDREMAKYVGQEKVIDVDQIPDELGQNFEQNPEVAQDRVLANEVIARKTGTRYVSGSRTSNGLPVPPTRSMGVTYQVIDASSQLMSLQQLAQAINVEVGMALGIPPQREAMTIPNTTATDNRQALVQSTLATQTIFHYLDNTWAHVLNEHLMNLKQYIQRQFAVSENLESYDLEYVLPDGSREYFSVLPEQMEHLNDIGLYLHDSGKEQLYFNMMLQSVFSFAQNAGEGVESVSGVLKALTTASSVEEMHKVIERESAKAQARVQAQMEQQTQMQEQMKLAQKELAEFQSSLKLEADLMKIREQRITNIEQAEIQSKALAAQYDINQNKESDLIEKAREDRAFEKEENEKDRKLALELENIKSKAKKGSKQQ